MNKHEQIFIQINQFIDANLNNITFIFGISNKFNIKLITDETIQIKSKEIIYHFYKST